MRVIFGAQPPLQPCAQYQQPLLLEESATKAAGITFDLVGRFT
jgi:hypothetical protein